MKFCAFLRGVNVKGTSMKMAEVVDVFKKAGVEDVSSVLATGNILFSSDKKAVELKKILEKAMSVHFNYEAFLFIKSENEVKEIFESNPFTKDENFHIYGFVGNKDVEKILFENFKKADKADDEDGLLKNGNFFWRVPKGNTLDSTFGKILGRKDLKDQFTSRNINTFEKIVNKF
ncbi:DUF1697 domain-containing protein [uncultured Chryseobacterium sp.]|uniref:DUF1697 domain-containing protein n=1 Tax=uncultured Chryseobacterium sp. TaxID=259322 RepID=UPI002638922C|nr:DUF1697 domain-containing protein [uncultured Chryseobacterium sp.]